LVSKRKQKEETDPVVKRLDAIIILFIEINKPETKKELNDVVVARTLHSVGLTSTEIAKMMDKKSPSDVAPYLYQKRKR
jgi:hypothetical protein